MCNKKVYRADRSTNLVPSGQFEGARTSSTRFEKTKVVTGQDGQLVSTPSRGLQKRNEFPLFLMVQCEKNKFVSLKSVYSIENCEAIQ